MVTRNRFYEDLEAVSLEVPLYEFTGPKDKFAKEFRNLSKGDKLVFLPEDNYMGRCEYQSARVLEPYDPRSGRLFRQGLQVSVRPSEVKRIGAWKATYREMRLNLRLNTPSV